MKRIIALFMFMFMSAAFFAGCSTEKKSIEHEGTYYFKEFYVDVLGYENGIQYVDYTLYYNKSACISNENEEYESYCDLLLLGDDYFMSVNDSKMELYVDGAKVEEQQYVLRGDYTFYRRSDSGIYVYEGGYFYEDGLIYYGDAEEVDIYMVFEKK